MAGPWIDPDRESQALTEAARRRRQYASMRQSATPEQAQRAVALVQSNPQLSAGLLQALLQAQVPDPVAQQLAEQDDGGGVFGAIGDALGSVTEVVTDGAEWALDKAYEYAIKPTIRGVTATSESLFEELVARPVSSVVATATGDASSIGQAYQAYGDSPLVNTLQGQGTLGTGFFAGDEAAAQTDRERTLTIRGQRADFGQAIAASTAGHFVDPGSTAYDIVAGVSGFAGEVFLDPLAWATAGASKAVKGARMLKQGPAIDLLAQAGGVNGFRRNTVLFEKARDFLANDEILERLAQADAYTIAQVWGRSPANRLNLKMARDLGNATDKAGVLDVLLRGVATGDVQRKGFYSGPGRFVRESLVESTSRFAGPFRYFTAEGKLSGLAPKGIVSADDLDTAANKVDSLLRQANIDRDVRASMFNRMANLEDGDFGGLFDVVRDAVDEVGGKLGDQGDLARLFPEIRNEIEAFRAFAPDPVDVPYAKRKVINTLDGEDVEIIMPTPQMTSELNSLALTLPDPTDIRRAATKNRVMRAVYESKGWDVTASATRKITRDVFKPLAILRPAYIVRIGLEEQARLSAAHYDSVFSHPLRFIQANILSRGDLTDLMGKDLTDVAKVNNVVTRDAYGVISDATSAHARLYSQVTKSATGEPASADFIRGWRAELGQISAADEARKMAELRGDMAGFKAWAQGDGRKSIERLAKVNKDDNALLEFGNQFDEWADGLRRRVESRTGGWDDDLIDDVVNGNIPMGGPAGAKNAELAAYSNRLRAKHNAGRVPDKVKVEALDEGRVRRMDRVVDGLFDVITGKPTSYLARFPAWRQSMIQRTADLMPTLATDELRRDVFARAVQSFGVKGDGKEFTALRKALDDALGTQGGIIDNVDDLNDIVVSRAADDVKDLLFDVTNRGAGQDAMEVVVPFLDAWKEVTVTWARLVKENPAFFVRAQAGYREMTDQGNFYVNDFGDTVFRYPGGGTLSAFVRRLNEAGGNVGDIPFAAAGAIGDTLTGNTPDASAVLEGRVQGLNLVAQGIGPGFGPVIQWGANVFQSPDTDAFREFLAPFGTGLDEPLDLLDPTEVGATLLPAWFKKATNALLDGGVDERQWNSTIGDAIKALAATDPDKYAANPDLLKQDAERYGKWLLFARSLTQFAGPTGASATTEIPLDADTTHPDWDPEMDPKGRFFTVGVLASDYHRLLRTYGPDEAARRFFELYGAEPYFIAQAKSRGLTESPLTTEGDNWMRDNRAFVEDYPVVAGLLATNTGETDLDFAVYQAQFARGERQSFTPQQQIELANKARAYAMYNTVKERVANLPPRERDRILDVTKGRLNELYPGWQADVVGVASGLRQGDKIAQLQRAVTDPRMDDNDAAKPIRAYMQMREVALEAARERGLKTLSSDKVADLRERLREVGLVLFNRYPGFASAWTDLLAREVE